jgi:hypothetical protein
LTDIAEEFMKVVVIALKWLHNALHDLCCDINRGAFQPILEAEVAAYLYHRLLANGCRSRRCTWRRGSLAGRLGVERLC